VTSTGLDQRTLDALLADARAAMTAYDDALAWLEIAAKGPLEPASRIFSLTGACASRAMSPTAVLTCASAAGGRGGGG
jgi:hypothetical protein